MENPEETTSEVSSVDVEEAPKFKTLAEAQAAFEKEVTATAELLTDAQEQIESLKADLEEANDSRANLATSLEKANEQIQAHANTIEKLEAEKKTVAEQSAAIAASVGAEPVATEGEEEQPRNILEQYQAITDPALKSHFLREHKTELVAASRA